VEPSASGSLPVLSEESGLLPDALIGAEWLGNPAAWSATGGPDGAVSITAKAGTDWSNDSLGGPPNASAAALLLAREGDFSFSARVRVRFAGTFDAGVLCLYRDENTWAKLCFELSPQDQPMVVSVVTRGYSDDVNSVDVAGDEVWLRISRIGEAYAFHYSVDGHRGPDAYWHFVRLFRMGDAGAASVGILSQAPMGESCTAVFSELRLSDSVPSDLRSGE
jgi:regulation of enolase protein 1 (concanavalin A-like superfamily)